MKKRRIYMDYAAATPLDPQVEKAMRPYANRYYGNPSSIHEEGRIAKEAVNNSRKIIADILCAQPDEIIFTGSGTESIALALQGVAAAYPKKHILIGSGEHAAVLENAKLLARDGCTITESENISRDITKNTVLISVMYVNNEMGAIQPIRDIAKIIRKERTRRLKAGESLPLYFHTDACQAPEYIDLSIPRLGVDMMSLNASKIYGPKGVGMLYAKRQLIFQPFWYGGGQEKGLRSGTENVAGIVGFAKALYVSEMRKKNEVVRMRKLQLYFMKLLEKHIPRANLIGPPIGVHRVVNNVYIFIPGISGESLVLFLDERSIATSTGSACDSRKHDSAKNSFNGVRFSFGRYTTKKDITYVINELCDSIKTLERAP